MGRNRDVYIAQGEAADNYCGRVLVGLPVNHENFAASYVDFIPVTVEESLNGGMDPNEYLRQQNDLNTEVNACIDEIFCAANLDRSPHQRCFYALVLPAIFGTGSHMICLSLTKPLHVSSCYPTIRPSGEPVYLLVLVLLLSLSMYRLQCLGKIVAVISNSQPEYHHTLYFSGMFED